MPVFFFLADFLFCVYTLQVTSSFGVRPVMLFVLFLFPAVCGSLLRKSGCGSSAKRRQNMENSNDSFLVREPVSSLMRKYSVPCIISLLVAALYNIVDQIFIANASYLGSCGNAANTVVYPLTVTALSIAVMIGDGACAFVSISLGAGKTDEAHRSVGNAAALTVVCSLVLAAVYLIFSDAIVTAFGGRVNAETFALSKEYFFWITLGIPFYMFGQAMNPVIRSDGDPQYAMKATLAGCFLNIILDPIFIYPLHMGMTGAAIATVAGQIVTAALSLRYMLHMKSITLSRSSFSLRFSLIRRFLFLGMTSFLSQISIVASMAAVQNMVLKYGALDQIFMLEEYAQIPMAVLGIVMKFFQIVISVSVGLAAGIIPVAGYNIGAGRKDRAKELFILLLKWEAVLGAAALLITELMPQYLIRIFGSAGESEYYTLFAVKSFRTYLCMMICATINKGTFIYLQSLGKALESTVLSLIREIVFGVCLPIILPLFMGLDGVLWSMPAADLMTFIIAAVLIIRTMKELSYPAQTAGTAAVY